MPFVLLSKLRAWKSKSIVYSLSVERYFFRLLRRGGVKKAKGARMLHVCVHGVTAHHSHALRIGYSRIRRLCEHDMMCTYHLRMFRLLSAFTV